MTLSLCFVPNETWSHITEIDYMYNTTAVTSHERHMTFSITCNSTLCQQLVAANNQGNIEALHHWPFVKGIHRWPVVSPHKGSVMRKTFPRHAVVMYRVSPSPGVPYFHFPGHELRVSTFNTRPTGADFGSANVGSVALELLAEGMYSFRLGTPVQANYIGMALIGPDSSVDISLVLCDVQAYFGKIYLRHNVHTHRDIINIYTVRYRYNAVNFMKNSHNRHPIARLWGRGLLWVWSLITFCCSHRSAVYNVVINWSAL